jgi:hypothetical protein
MWRKGKCWFIQFSNQHILPLRFNGMFQRSLLLMVLALVVLISCASPVSPEPQPTPDLVTVAIDPAVLHLGEALQLCSDASSTFTVTLQEINPAIQDWGSYDLNIRLGEPEELPGFAALLGVEQVVIVVHTNNPVDALSEEVIKGIFSGRITRWNEISGASQPIQVWTYPEEEQVNRIFDSTIMAGGAITSHALLAPNAAAMLEAISGDPNAIGYLPRAWIQDSVRVVELVPQLMQKLRLPVLALADNELAEAPRQLLYCLQQGEGSEVLSRLYETQ